MPIPSSHLPAGVLPLALVIVAMTLAGCTHDEPGAVGQLDIAIHEELVLGGDESSPLEEQFSAPASVDTDEDGRIYVVDERENLLKVFNSDGTLAWTAGSTGQGPGEFQRMQKVVVSDGRVLVLDNGPRAINWYHRDGSLGGQFTPSPTDLHVNETLSPLKGSRFVTAAGWVPDRESLLAEPLLIVMDSAFNSVTARFGILAELGVDPGDWWQLIAVRPGTVAVGNDEETIYFVPQAYEGRIFRFTRSGDRWVLAGALEGYAPLPRPASLTEDVTIHQNVTKLFMAGQPGPLTFAIHHTSLALYELVDGRLAHLSMLEQEGRLVQYVELFDHSGRLLAYGPLPVYPEGSTLERVWDRMVMHKDEQDRFYFRDRRSELPTLSVVRIEFTVL